MRIVTEGRCVDCTRPIGKEPYESGVMLGGLSDARVLEHLITPLSVEVCASCVIKAAEKMRRHLEENLLNRGRKAQL